MNMTMIVTMGLGGMAVALLLIYVSLRRRMTVQIKSQGGELRQQLHEAKAQKDLFAQILDNQSRCVFVTNAHDRIIYANRSLLQRYGKTAAQVYGKPLTYVFPAAQAQRYEQRNHEALSTQAPMVAIDSSSDAIPLITQVQHIPLPSSLSQDRECVLVTEEDISTLVLEKQRRERILHEVVRFLVALVDRRDPNAANHSLRVGKVARGIAEEMRLDSTLVETAATAGELMNIGKIFVPVEVLTKPGALTEDERKLMRRSLRHATELLSSIEFDGPVIQALLQCQERYNGTGWPDGWKGEDIIAPARVISAANAFVALVSPRSHRLGVSVDQALATLRKEAGAYDPRVLNALETYLNTGGRVEWQMTTSNAARA